MPSAHKIELQIVSPSGKPLGLVIVGIPEDQFLKLKAEFPDKGFSGQQRFAHERIRNTPAAFGENSSLISFYPSKAIWIAFAS